MMEENAFWKLVEDSRALAEEQNRELGQDFLSVHEQTLAAALEKLSLGEITDFNDRFWHFHQRAYRWDLWAAAYWLHGGCSDDGFIDFRSTLISLGKDMFFRVIYDPDSLAEIIDRPNIPYLQGEGFQYVASKVYRKKSGRDISYSPGPVVEPAGERIDHDDPDIMREHFPKLVSKFPEMGD